MVREYMPTLFEASESSFTSNGYGFLADGISCEVTEEIGNSFELEMTYPITGVYYDLLQIGNIICCRTNTHKTTKQPFRIYRITKPIDGIVTVYAQHISYDLAGYTVDEVNTTYAKDNAATVDTIIEFIQQCANKYCSEIGGLMFSFTKSGTFETAAWDISAFTDVRTMMKTASRLFNGQWEYNGTTCTLYARRGADRGVTIEYGKNLTGIREDADISSTYTHVMPYYKGTEGEGEQKHDVIVGGLSAAVQTGAEIGYNRTKGLDLSSEYNSTPTVEQLQERAQKYIAVSEIGKIVISRDVQAVDRGKTLEYPQLDGEEIIEIGDTIGIKVPVLGISATMDCMRLTYDAYLDIVKSYEIGDIKKNFISTVADDDKEVKNKIDDIDDWIDDTDDRLDDIEEALHERAPTLFVQEDEPEGTEQDPLMSGDEWLQIDEDKNAIAYYKYSSSWTLQCYFGGRFDPIIQNEQPIDTTSQTETYDLWVNVKGTIADTDTLANINIANVRGLWEKGSGWTKKAYAFGKTNPVATMTTQQGDYWFKVDNDGLITELSECTSITIVGQSITATWAQVFPNDQTGHSVVIYLENREPVKQGDYWLKIENNQSKLAQQLGRWSGSQWDLVLDFGDGGGGVGEYMDKENDPHTPDDYVFNSSERFNDYRNFNLTTKTGGNWSQQRYDHVEGYNNHIYFDDSEHQLGYRDTPEGYNHLEGYGNSLILPVKNSGYPTRAQCVHIEGYNNTFISDDNDGTLCVHIEGYRNSLHEGINYSNIGGYQIVSGKNEGDNYYGSATFSIIHGNQITYKGSSTCSIITGQNHQIKNAPFAAIFGECQSISYGSSSLIAGVSHDVSAYAAAVFGDNNKCRQSYSLVSGHGADDEGTYYLVIGNNGNILTLDGNGNLAIDGNYSNGGADYAEYFEWLDGNLDNEDRCGMLVELSGDKIALAHGDEIFGIISANPSVCGNAYETHWHGKYERDIYGRIMKDEAGKPIISEKYDKRKKYIPRSERKEWAAVGMTGRLVINDDGSCKVGGYVSARNGVGTSCYKNTGVKVLRRLDNKHVEVVIK